MKRLVMTMCVAVCLVPVLATRAGADVTVRMQTKGPMGDSPAVYYIKGMKIRTESSLNNEQMISIIDLQARRMTVLNPQTREAMIIDLAKLADQMQQATKPQDPKVSLTPTGQTRQLLGRECAGYMLSLDTTMSMGPNTIKVNVGGPVWLAKDAPGATDWEAFFKAAGEQGLFFGGAGGGRGTSQGRSQSLMYKALADAGGIPYEQEIKVKVEGGPPGIPQAPSVTMTVTGVSIDPIADDKFTVPAGYVTRKQ